MKTTRDHKKIYSLKEALKACEAIIGGIAPNKQKGVCRFEFPIQPLDLLSWVDAQDFVHKIYWADREKTLRVAAVGVADAIVWKTAIDYDKILKRVREHLLGEFPQQRYYGGFCFDASYLDSDWTGFGTSRFVMPRFEIFQDEHGTFFACNIVFLDNELDFISSIVRDLKSITFRSMPQLFSFLQPINREDIPSRNHWNHTVDGIIDRIENGRYEKIVLARKSRFTFDSSLNPFQLIHRLEQLQSDCFLFVFQFKKNESFFGASPERLYKRLRRAFYTEAIAGTRPRGETTAEDNQNKQDLLESTKDAHEHRIVVHALQKSVYQLCSLFEIETVPSLLSLHGGLHLITRIHGELNPFASDTEVLKIVHPTPAIAGSPTVKAMVEIKEKESFSRGWYSGLVGYVGGDYAEFVVAIRSGLVKKNILNLYAGAGIVAGSTSRNEWDEIEHKLDSILKIFQNESSQAS